MADPLYYEVRDKKLAKGEVRATFQPPNPSTWEVDSQIGKPRNIGPSVSPRTQYSTGQKVRAAATTIADKARPITTKAVNWVFTGSTDGVRRGQWARDNRQSGRDAGVPARPRTRTVYVREPAPPRRTARKKQPKEPDYSGWGSGWGKI